VTPVASVGRVLVNVTRRVRRRPRARLTKVVVVSDRGDLPKALNARRLYQLGDPGKWAILECPCGRGHVIELNLAHPGRDMWRLTQRGDGQPSLRPSVDYRGARRCHYWLRDGWVEWT
jgi:Family of unknown function (DUF6527)